MARHGKYRKKPAKPQFVKIDFGATFAQFLPRNPMGYLMTSLKGKIHALSDGFDFLGRKISDGMALIPTGLENVTHRLSTGMSSLFPRKITPPPKHPSTETKHGEISHPKTIVKSNLAFAREVIVETNYGIDFFAMMGGAGGAFLGGMMHHIDELVPKQKMGLVPGSPLNYVAIGGLAGFLFVSTIETSWCLYHTLYQKRRKELIAEIKARTDKTVTLESEPHTIFTEFFSKKGSFEIKQPSEKILRVLKNTGFFALNSLVNNIFKLKFGARLVIGCAGMLYLAGTPEHDIIYTDYCSGLLQKGSSTTGIYTNMFSAFLEGMAAVLYQYEANLDPHVFLAITISVFGPWAVLYDWQKEYRDDLTRDINLQLAWENWGREQREGGNRSHQREYEDDEYDERTSRGYQRRL